MGCPDLGLEEPGGGGQALGSAPWRCLEAGPASAPLQVGSDHLGEPARGGGGVGRPS